MLTLFNYWCEAVARVEESGHTHLLSTQPASTPRLALRWLRGRVRDVAEQLDPAPAQPASYWLDDQLEHERALSALAAGEAYAFVLADDTTRYVLSVRPIGTER
ncbi:hypothetical protein ACFOSC_17985 [Streptantibioticus rubrisoli]|uniref:Uncharacterized protein n=1 Tax=Streptantibioticus rubrisoli TaxID=1387313 RepID=A0ABT1PJJ7_9ACTN|nr:hypothetical protein [Streptantibioticus rubrisoli]MCQ4044673.1 hypothetical protein [Streptantibioticus rubrisoli]